jgi:hypothetical protein
LNPTSFPNSQAVKDALDGLGQGKTVKMVAKQLSGLDIQHEAELLGLVSAVHICYSLALELKAFLSQAELIFSKAVDKARVVDPSDSEFKLYAKVMHIP